MIAVLWGTLRFNVPVDFSTANDTALGISLHSQYFYYTIPPSQSRDLIFGLSAAGLDYEATSRSLTFNDQSRQSVFVPIIDNDFFEDPENFFGRLSADGVLPPNVRLAPIEATATIIDDDCMLNVINHCFHMLYAFYFVV